MQFLAKGWSLELWACQHSPGHREIPLSQIRSLQALSTSFGGGKGVGAPTVQIVNFVCWRVEHGAQPRPAHIAVAQLEHQ